MSTAKTKRGATKRRRPSVSLDRRAVSDPVMLDAVLRLAGAAYVVARFTATAVRRQPAFAGDPAAHSVVAVPWAALEVIREVLDESGLEWRAGPNGPLRRLRKN
jgi:hypothetical protein